MFEYALILKDLMDRYGFESPAEGEQWHDADPKIVKFLKWVELELARKAKEAPKDGI